MNRPHIFLLSIIAVALLSLIVSCASHPTITIMVPKESNISLKEYKSLAVAPFLAKNDDIGINEKSAEEIVYALEHRNVKVTVIPLGGAKTTDPLPGESPEPNEDYFEGWKRLARKKNVDLLLCGTVEFKSNFYSDYETRTEFDLRTGRSRPVRYEVFRTMYFLQTTFNLIDLEDDVVLLEKTIEQTHEIPKIAKENNIYIFFDLMDRSIEKLIEEVQPRKVKSLRYLL